MSGVSIRDLFAGAVPVGGDVTLKGWVRSRRDSKQGFSFINLHDGSCFDAIQVVADKSLPGYEKEIRHLTTGCAIVATGDGFEIAERDLEIRGPGELFGARQSGVPPFRVAEMPRDLDLLRLARRDAVRWIKSNPTLGGERDALLKRRLLKAHGEALGLGDVG